jgi:type III restriction enzyme
MRRSIIAYDRDLPEIPDRCSWLAPDCHLVKDKDSPTGYRVAPGRRRSNLLLVNGLRGAVEKWRKGGYQGASDVSRRLLEYWFEEDHDVPGLGSPFRYHFGQREAIETLIYLLEVVGNRDAIDLVKTYAEINRKDLLENTVEFSTSSDGTRRIRRFVEEIGTVGI